MTVERLVRRERTRLRSVLAARGAGAAVAVVALVLAAAVLALGGARWIAWPAVPLVVWGVALVLAVTALIWTQRAMHRDTATARVAREIERDRALRSGALRGALEVSGGGALAQRAADTLAQHLAPAGAVLASSLHRRVARHRVVAAVGAVGALLLLGAARNAAPDGWLALRHPVGAFTGSLLPPIEIEHPPGFVMRGEKVRVRVTAPERRTLDVHVRTTGTAWDTLNLPLSRGAGSTVLGPLDADLTIVATDGRVSSDTVTIRVTDRPFVGDVAIRAAYPAYLGRPAETVPLGEPARVPRGTVLTISGRASTDLRSVGLRREQDSVRLEPDGHGFSGRLVALASGHFTWFAAGALGAIPDLPQPLDLEVVTDSAPQVEVLAPAHDTIVLPDARLTLRVAASDDHGLSDITLETRRKIGDGALMPALAQTLAAPHAPQWSGAEPLDLSPRGLQPGDELQVSVAATDNSPWRQTARSRTVVLRVPSLSEQRQQARALADSTVAQLAAATKSERELAERTGEAARTRSDRPSVSSSSSLSQSDWSQQRPQDAQPRTMSYQSAEQAREIARDQQALQNQVRDAQARATDLERQLRAAGALDSTLASQLHDVQQMLHDALTPELQQQLNDVLKATQRLSPEQARQALQNLAEQQKRLRDALERTTEMLRRAGLEGSMQTLRDEAKEIAQNEKALADSLAHRNSRGDTAALSRRASKLSQQSRDLAEDVQQLQKRLQQEKAQAGPRTMNGVPQHADTSSDAMQRVATADPSRQAQRTQDAQQGAQQMDQAAQQLASARDEQIQEWKRQLTSQLDQSIQETMQLARRQQQLADRARTEQNADLRPDQSAVQQGVRQVQQRLQDAARKSAHISPQSQGALGDASRRVQEATRSAAARAATGEGDRTQVASAMDEAAQALNRAAAQMMKDRTSAANGSSASGFAEMLQRMRDAAKAQGGVNSGTAGLLPVPGAQPSAQMMADARALANQQRAIAQKLDDAGNGGEARAAELAREMRQIAASLDRGHVDQQLLDRQQRLFHRLLDAGLTLEKDEREDTGKRESQVGGDEAVINNGPAVHGTAAERYKEPSWSELRGLTADERRAVLDYFKRINAPNP